MKKSRRELFQQVSLGLLAAAPPSPASGPGAPPAFNTSPAVGPAVSPSTFSEAGKLMQVAMTHPQRVMAAKSWRTSMASVYEWRTGPRKVALEASLAPASVWSPLASGPGRSQFLRALLIRGRCLLVMKTSHSRLSHILRDGWNCGN